MGKFGYCVLTLFLILLAVTISSPVFANTMLGDANVEPATGTLVSQYVMALTKFTVTSSTTIEAISLFLQYGGSDGSQCIKFGVYRDNGGRYGQSSPLNQPLIAATHNGYCLQIGDFGPAWETWALLPGDFMTVGPGTYWLCTLASEGYGTVYHFTYTGSYGGQFLYQYGYFYYGFPASYALGYPPTVFGNTTYTDGQGLILPFNSANIGDYDAPYSFFAIGT
ncbi:MAG TPA: hypothetical protein VED86_07550 [archaeon]|nr:hypothetical protein [archaeon]